MDNRTTPKIDALIKLVLAECYSNYDAPINMENLKGIFSECAEDVVHSEFTEDMFNDDDEEPLDYTLNEAYAIYRGDLHLIYGSNLRLFNQQLLRVSIFDAISHLIERVYEQQGGYSSLEAFCDMRQDYRSKQGWSLD